MYFNPTAAACVVAMGSISRRLVTSYDPDKDRPVQTVDVTVISRGEVFVRCTDCGLIGVLDGPRAQMVRHWPGLKCGDCATGYLIPPRPERG